MCRKLTWLVSLILLLGLGQSASADAWKASNPVPSDGATDVSPNVTLSWDYPYGWVILPTFDMYFGTDYDAVYNANTSDPEFLGNVDSNEYHPSGPLDFDETYYWRADSVVPLELHKGTVWSFTTMSGPEKATNPYPADGAEDVPLNVTLSWDPGSGATSHDVYFGTSSSPPFIGNQTTSDYNPGTLEPDTRYYWQIDTVRQIGEIFIVYTGDVWSFTTAIVCEAGWDVSNVRLNGGGTSLTVGPGDSVRLQYDFEVWNGSDVPSAIRQVLAGLVKTSWSQVIDGCAYHGIPAVCPSKTSGSFDYTFNAPTEPGTYQLVAAMDAQYTCDDAKNIFPEQTYSETVATITVGCELTKASNPSPADGATDVDPNAILSWIPGCLAAFEDVYFGTDFDAVDNADTSDTTGIYRGRQPFDANSYTPPETLEPDITHYWRVDGVNNLHADSPWKGDLWSLTGGLKADEPNEPNKPKWRTGYTGYYTTDEESTVQVPLLAKKPWNVADSNNQITVTLKTGKYIWLGFINLRDADKNKRKYFQLMLKGAAVSNLDKPEEVKGFLDTEDKQPVSVRRCGGPRWEKGKRRRFRYRFGPPQPCWVRFKFNAKNTISGKKITIMAWSICCRVEYWKTGKWPTLPELKSFGIGGPGAESGVSEVTNIENYVFSIWDASFLSQSPGAVIGDPRITDIYVFPDSSTVDTLVPPNFSADPSTGNWTASFVYTDPNGDSRPQGGVRFASDGPGLGTSDRFNLQVFVAGLIDSTYELYAYDQDSGQYMDFGIDVDTLECIDVVDDFEDYDSDAPNRIFETWIDGFGYASPLPGHPGNGTGAIVGNSEAPIAEQTIVYEGGQSMPFRYDNSGSYRKPFYSETERTFVAPQDWTKDGIEVLTLGFFGDPNNVAEPMYLAVEDSIGHTAVVYHDDPNAVLIDDWTEWNIDLKGFADQGVNLADVSSIAIGVGDRYNPIPGGSGTIYFDDIRLCRPIDVAGEGGTPFAADLNSDSVVDMAELGEMAEEWLTLRQ